MDRLTPCQCCGFSLSQRHHLRAFADYGESDATIQLCANCHELYHLIWRSYADKSRASKLILGRLCLKPGEHQKAFDFLYPLVIETYEREIAEGQEACRIAEELDAAAEGVAG